MIAGCADKKIALLAWKSLKLANAQKKAPLAGAFLSNGQGDLSLSENLHRCVLAAATIAAETEFILKVPQVAGAFVGGRSHLLVSNGVADTNVHSHTVLCCLPTI